MADDSAIVPLRDIQVNDCLNYVERQVEILDRRMKILRNKVVSLVKVQWQHRKGSEWTWELESKMCEHFLELFTTADFEVEV